ncbi:hypothetical protein RND71_006469 [Anisodus tanguticus]|uniref:CBS domain-containing protein n=1 Tax=Anisodus tanguticus TaxID=243964 RepID=A0AAE1STE2_9SOLA|nr:hypothetical protein RND71_006469 [Anisodus tanguticus]
MGARNLSKEEYAANHPAGRIGKSLIFKVFCRESWKVSLWLIDRLLCSLGWKEFPSNADVAVVEVSWSISDFLLIAGRADIGGNLNPFGLEGWVRRTEIDLRLGSVEFHLSNLQKPRTIGPDAMAVEAMQKMESPPSPVQFLPVIDHENVLISIVTLHGLVSAGL